MYKDYIFIKNKAVPKKHCEEVVHLLDTSSLSKPENENLKNFYKGIFNVETYNQPWFKSLTTGIKEYKKLNPFLDSSYLSRWFLDSFCNYQKYEKNNAYNNEHCEVGYTTGRHSKRVLGWMFYCNTIKEGGETYFPQQDNKVKATQGTLVIWPAGWTHSHYGIPAKERKYIVTGWSSFV